MLSAPLLAPRRSGAAVQEGFPEEEATTAEEEDERMEEEEDEEEEEKDEEQVRDTAVEEESWKGSNSGGFKCCCREMELLEFRDKFVFKSLDPDVPGTGFSIGRPDGAIQPLPVFAGDSHNKAPNKVSLVYGLVGTIKLLAGKYILVITSRKEVGSHLGASIFLVTSMKFLACNEVSTSSSSEEKSDEAYFMTLLKTLETTPGLYYSYETDLTLNLQRLQKLGTMRFRKPLWKQADPRFVWNHNLLEELIECKLDAFTIPLIQGSYQSVQVRLKNLPAKLTLISRRCTRRLGTRMWRRGANLDGDTANFIETEQLVEIEGFRFSFLQIRGSIPLLWEQIVDLSYKPRLNILNHTETSKVVERHFHDLSQRYGEIVAVDLTDKHGDEGQLNRAFASEMEKLSNFRYVSFDFHYICGNANFDNLQILYEQISSDIEKQGYFSLNEKGETLSEQKGSIRVNCIDCLDRTNVTQSFLGRKVLDLQLQKIGVFSSSDSISTHVEVNEKFKTLWVDHGDEISLEYSGTHALKGDLVRFGRQTLSGLIKDGMSAISRYYLNNFQDGIRQDALDLISGHYVIRKSCPSLHLNGLESLSYLPVASALVVGGITATTVTLNQATRNTQQFLSSVVLAGLTVGVVALIKANGRQFCSRPRLCNLL